jgi:predicted alpha/beta superfamily hydrolase
VNDRTIWGHSLAGSFVLFAFFDPSTVFNRYIATSPALILDGVQLIDAEAELPLSKQALPTRLFVSVGSADQSFGPQIRSFATTLQNKHYSNLQLTTSTIDGFGHSSALPLGFIRGLRTVFST